MVYLVQKAETTTTKETKMKAEAKYHIKETTNRTKCGRRYHSLNAAFSKDDAKKMLDGTAEGWGGAIPENYFCEKCLSGGKVVWHA